MWTFRCWHVLILASSLFSLEDGHVCPCDKINPRFFTSTTELRAKYFTKQCIVKYQQSLKRYAMRSTVKLFRPKVFKKVFFPLFINEITIYVVFQEVGRGH